MATVKFQGKFPIWNLDKSEKESMELMLPFPDQTPDEVDNCEHLKGLPKGYPFDLHSKTQNPKRWV